MASDQEIITEALERFKQIQDREAMVRPRMIDDQLFDDGQQWNPDDENRREREKKPKITVPLNKQFSNRLRNEQRQNKPQITVRPVGDSDKKAAKFRKGLLKDIQYQSKAQLAYQTAYNHSVVCGRGHWLITTEFAGQDNFDQNVIIETIGTPLNVYLDWEHKEPDYSDCRYGFIIEVMNKKVFKKKYPNASEQHFASVIRSNSNNWLTSDQVQVARYYTEKIKKRTLLKLRKEVNGEIEEENIFRDAIKDKNYDKNVKPYIVDKRTVDFKTWHWYKMTSVEILDEHELPGIKKIPIATVIGEESTIEGELNIKGIIRDIKDLGRMYNFWSSQETELVSLAPRAPYIGAKGQFTGIPQWQDANTTNYSYLEYNPIAANGQPVPPPQRQQFAGVPVGIVQAKQMIADNMKSVTGMYDPSLGKQGQARSGIALRTEQETGDTANYHFIDNYANAMNHTGRVINDMLPIYYSDGRTISLLGDDDNSEEVMLGKLNKQGEKVLLGDGEYDVRVEVGPSYSTRRQEAADTMLELMAKVPMVSQLGGDLAVKNMDLPMSDEMSGRLKKGIKLQYGEDMVAPVVDEDDDQTRQMQMQLQQATAQLQQLQQQMQQAQQALEKAQADKQAAEAGKAQALLKDLEIKQQKLMDDSAKWKAEIQLKDKERQDKMLIADLETAKDVSINDKKLEVEVLKEANSQDNAKETRTIEQARPPEKPTPIPKLPDQKVEVNVHGSEVKKSVITTPKGEKYHVETREGDNGTGDKK